MRFFFLTLAATFCFSCHKDSPTPSLAEFSIASLSLKESDPAYTINIPFLSPSQAAGSLTITLTDSTASYGQDYLTLPAATNNTITLQISKGDSSSSFSFIPKINSGFDGDKIVSLTISGHTDRFSVGPVGKVNVTIIDDDLICFLPLDGNVLDYSDYGNSSTNDGGTWVSGKDGSPNSAFQLDGISNEIIVTNSQVLDTLQKLTITAWINPISYRGGGNDGIVEKPFTSHIIPYYQYKLGITGDQYPNFPQSFEFSLSIDSQFVKLVTPLNAWTPGNWCFVAATYDGSVMSLYVNGTLVSSQSAAGVLDYYGQNIYMGTTHNKSYFTPGTFGAMRIYNRALSSSEIGALYLR